MPRPSFSSDDLYRRLHLGNPGDVAFYGRACEEAATVLEFGSGWGRLALPLAEAGLDVLGVDSNAAWVSEANAAALRSKTSLGAAHFTHADLRDFRSERRFDRVLLPYNVLFALGGLTGVTRALETAAVHLAPGGEIWLDVYSMDGYREAALRGDVEIDGEDRELVAEWADDAGTLEVFESTSVALPESRLTVRYDALDGEERVATSTIVHHFFTSEELERALDDAGLESAGRWGSFDGAPFDDESELLLVCATRR